MQLVAGTNLDLEDVAGTVLRDIEVIDLSAPGANALTFTRSGLIALSPGITSLRVAGDANDSVTSVGQGWDIGGIGTNAGQQYQAYGKPGAIILIDTNIQATIS